MSEDLRLNRLRLRVLREYLQQEKNVLFTYKLSPHETIHDFCVNYVVAKYFQGHKK
jgi:hypothetical protein